LLAQSLVFAGLSLAGWGAGAITRASVPSMLRLGPPPAMEAIFADAGRLDWPLETANGEIVSTAGYAGTATDWFGVRQAGPTINLLSPLKTLHALANMGDATLLFVVPARAMSDGPLYVGIGGQRYTLQRLETDPAGEFDVMGTVVSNQVLGAVADPIGWALNPWKSGAPHVPVLLRIDPRRTSSAAYLLTSGSIQAGSTGGKVDAALSDQALGAAVVGYNSSGPELLGFVEAQVSPTRYVAVSQIVPVLISSAVLADSEELGRPLLGIEYGTRRVIYRRTGGSEVAGLRVNIVVPGGPASQAGLTSGMLIIAIDGVSTPTAMALQTATAEFRFGTTHQISVVTPFGVERQLTVRIPSVGG
jgi:hypothetical protein